MEECTKRRQIPTFGHWDYSDVDLPITQYFESALQSHLIRSHFLVYDSGDDLSKVQAVVPIKPAHHHHRKAHKKQVRTSEIAPKQAVRKKPPNMVKTPKAVDEDLYKIPSELLCKKPKRKRLVRNLVSGCLGLNCIA